MCILYCEYVFDVCLFYLLFFFFKQKTAYEMRISDWSSDVCSSDLRIGRRGALEQALGEAEVANLGHGLHQRRVHGRGDGRLGVGVEMRGRQLAVETFGRGARQLRHGRPRRLALCILALHQRHRFRSEEPTSELQSLMRISYAVFCLKKENHDHN